MKKTKKLLAFLLAMVMMLAMGMTAMAAGTGTITITPPEGTATTAYNEYKIYKVFDADGDGANISYKLVEGKTTAPAGFSVDSAGNVTYAGLGENNQLTADDIAAIAAYVTTADRVATVFAVGTGNAVAENLPNGYYYITTSTGTVVTINSTNPNATVIDKNTVPTLDKKIDEASSVDTDGKKALAEIGSAVVYEATITVGNGAKGYVFYDKMSDGLSWTDDTKLYLNEVDNDPEHHINSDNYDIYRNVTENDVTYTFKLALKDSYMQTLEAGDKIIIRYSATINDNALTIDPEKNTAYLSYGDAYAENKTPVSETKTWNAQISVVKYDGKNTDSEDDDTVLAGAGFVLKNSAGKYYHLDETNQDNPVVEWLDNIADADEHVSGADGKVAPFTGLANGTYTLEEKTVPAGYNKAADTEITIAEHNYESSNLEQSATVINNKGTELPSTGGIGTTMFYVIGGALVLVAVVLLVTRKRMSVEK